MMIDASSVLLVGLACVLTLSSLIAGMARLMMTREKKTAAVNLSTRVKSWWIMAAVLAAAFLAGEKAVIILFALTSLACLRELFTVIRAERADRATLLVVFYVAAPAQYLLIWNHWYREFVFVIPVFAFILLPVLAAITGNVRDFLARTAELQWAVMISVYCVSYVPALVLLHIRHSPAAAGAAGTSILLAVFLIAITQCSDIMQYVFGKLLGRRLIAPAISPGKTIEGLAGGLASATLLGAALSWITPFSPSKAAAIGFLVAVMGFLGGLVMSAIKRDRGIKDWSQMIPGHGGMLDRLDSVYLSAPVFFHLTRCLIGS